MSWHNNLSQNKKLLIRFNTHMCTSVVSDLLFYPFQTVLPIICSPACQPSHRCSRLKVLCIFSTDENNACMRNASPFHLYSLVTSGNKSVGWVRSEPWKWKPLRQVSWQTLLRGRTKKKSKFFEDDEKLIRTVLLFPVNSDTDMLK